MGSVVNNITMLWNSRLKMAGKYCLVALLSCILSFQQLFAYVIWSDATQQQKEVVTQKQQSSFKQSDVLKAENNFPFAAFLMQTEDESEEDADDNVDIQKAFHHEHSIAHLDYYHLLSLLCKLKQLENEQLNKANVPLFLLHQSWKHFLS